MNARPNDHDCEVPRCDGTRLGHDLAVEFPEETRRIDEAFDRLTGPREDRVMPENLQIGPADVRNGLAPHVAGHPPAEVRLPDAYEDEQQRQRDELEDWRDREELRREREREWFE